MGEKEERLRQRAGAVRFKFVETTCIIVTRSELENRREQEDGEEREELAIQVTCDHLLVDLPIG